MNAKRRAALQKIADTVSDLQSQIDAINEEEQEARDNIPASLQGSERYEKAEAAVDALYNASCSLQECYDAFVIEAMA